MTQDKNKTKDRGDQNIKDVSKNKDSKEINEELEDYKARYKRVLADYQNLEKRVREERVNWIKSANKDLILRILPILDTLVLAANHSQDPTLKIAKDQFLDIVEGEGAVKIETKDMNFDPKLMECVETVEGESGKVIEEVRPGYLQNDVLIRPALVKVGK